MRTSLYDTFWDLISLARQEREQFLMKLKQIDRQSLIEFCWTYQITAATFKYEPYMTYQDWDSEDGIDEISQWIVGQGKDYYTKVLENPDLMPKDVPGQDPALGYLSDAVREHKARYHELLPYPDEDFYLALENETGQL